MSMTPYELYELANTHRKQTIEREITTRLIPALRQGAISGLLDIRYTITDNVTDKDQFIQEVKSLGYKVATTYSDKLFVISFAHAKTIQPTAEMELKRITELNRQITSKLIDQETGLIQDLANIAAEYVGSDIKCEIKEVREENESDLIEALIESYCNEHFKRYFPKIHIPSIKMECRALLNDRDAPWVYTASKEMYDAIRPQLVKKRKLN